MEGQGRDDHYAKKDTQRFRLTKTCQAKKANWDTERLRLTKCSQASRETQVHRPVRLTRTEGHSGSQASQANKDTETQAN